MCTDLSSNGMPTRSMTAILHIIAFTATSPPHGVLLQKPKITGFSCENSERGRDAHALGPETPSRLEDG